MFHALMGRFQLELIYSNYQFFNHRLIQQLRQKTLQHPTRPFKNVALATKGLQERKTQLLNGTRMEKFVIKIDKF